MTRVDFYVLSSRSRSDRFRLACRIASRALRSGHRVLVHVPGPDEARHLDQLLWTFDDQSFVPHGLLGEADPEINPILIGDGTQAPEEHDVLVNLAREVPTFFGRFARLAECIDNEPGVREAGRERYRFYKDRGYPMQTHEVA